MKRVIPPMILTVLLFAVPGAALEPAVGTWKTVDERTGKVISEVEIYEHRTSFDKIIGLTEPNEAQGKPKTCSKCTRPNKDRPIVGLVIIKDLRVATRVEPSSIPTAGRATRPSCAAKKAASRSATTSPCSPVRQEAGGCPPT